MKASLKALPFGLLLLLFVPLSTAHAQGPSLSPIPNVSLNAGGTLNVNVIAVDAEDRLINVTAALPPFVTLNTPTIGTGIVVTNLTLAPSGAQVGDYTAAVTATAGGVSTVRVFQITVNAAGSDQAPIVVAPAWQEVTAGSALSFGVTASDADGDAITSLSASGLPMAATFMPNGVNSVGTLNWTPGAEDVGDYDVVFTAANALSGTGVTHLRVTSPPTLMITPIDDVTVAGGGFLSVPVHASGVPDALITLTAALPAFATLNPPGSGTGVVNTTVTVSPPTGSAGTYHASITAISLGPSVTEDFDIIVTGDGPVDNRAPIVTAPATAMVELGSTLSFDVTATDPDGDHVDLIGSALPPGSDFTDHGDETGTFTWTPGQAGSFMASFTGLDGRGGSGSASTMITVTGGAGENNAPTLSAPLTETVQEGVTLSFMVTASDPDGDHVALSGASLPFGAMFTDNGDNSGTFSWTPGSMQSGTYEAAFLGDDGNGGTGTASTSITVTEGAGENHAPTVSAPPTAQVDEGVELSFTVTASDPDGDHVTLTANSLPQGAMFDDHGDNTGTFSWTPGPTQSGNYGIVFLGNDGNGGTGTASTNIQVRDVADGGVAEVPGSACLIGTFKPQRDSTCFRIKPVDHSFDPRDVVLSSITFRFHGESIPALDGAHIELDCRPGNRQGHYAVEGGAHDKRDGQGDCNKDPGDDHSDDICGVSCPDHGNDHEDADRGDPHGSCDTLGIRACFPTDALVRLFEAAPATGGKPSHRWNPLPCALLDAEILATLTNGATVVATFDDTHHKHQGDDHKDWGKGDHGHDGVDHNGDSGTSGHEEALGAKLRPNPLNPSTQLSFTMPSDGRVHVAVYDMQGRLVRSLLNDFRSAGSQTLSWDGTDESNLRVANGVYFVRIQTVAGAITRRVTVVR